MRQSLHLEMIDLISFGADSVCTPTHSFQFATPSHFDVLFSAFYSIKINNIQKGPGKSIRFK